MPFGSAAAAKVARSARGTHSDGPARSIVHEGRARGSPVAAHVNQSSPTRRARAIAQALISFVAASLMGDASLIEKTAFVVSEGGSRPPSTSTDS